LSILVTGQCSLEWGRMEFGNVGNNYVTHGLFRMLRSAFPQTPIMTTFEVSTETLQHFDVKQVGLTLFADTLENAETDLRFSQVAEEESNISMLSPFLRLLQDVDMVIDVSGDMWGDNASYLGPERFTLGLTKIRTAQVLGKKTALVATSPGPFEYSGDLSLAKETYAGFDLVLNREAESERILKEAAFDLSQTFSLACPSILYRGSRLPPKIQAKLSAALPAVGLSICGWNFPEGPFDKFPRDDNEYAPLVELVRWLERSLGLSVILFSHSNGFSMNENGLPIHHHGRDFPLVERVHTLLEERDGASNAMLVDEYLHPGQVHSLIRSLDLLVTGRAHAAIAGLSGGVPTILIDYGNGPTAHKTKGFMKIYRQEQLIARMADLDDLKEKIRFAWHEREAIKSVLVDAQEAALIQINQMSAMLRSLYEK